MKIPLRIRSGVGPNAPRFPRYIVVSGIPHDTETGERTVYGICMLIVRHHRLLSLAARDICADRRAVESLCEKMRLGKPEAVSFRDIVEDFLTERYAGKE